jgi:hypothetical protein
MIYKIQGANNHEFTIMSTHTTKLSEDEQDDVS